MKPKPEKMSKDRSVIISQETLDGQTIGFLVDEQTHGFLDIEFDKFDESPKALGIDVGDECRYLLDY